MKFLEKELEDYICDNPQSLAPFAFDALGPKNAPITILGRQVTTPCGIIDIIFSTGLHLFIAELKAHKAGDKELGQLSRYHDYVTNYLYHLNPLQSEETWPYIYALSDVTVHKVLIATSFDNLVSYTSRGNCHLIAAKKHGNGFAFSGIHKWVSIADNAKLEKTLTPFGQYVASLGHEKARISTEIRAEATNKAIKESFVSIN